LPFLIHQSFVNSKRMDAAVMKHFDFVKGPITDSWISSLRMNSFDTEVIAVIQYCADAVRFVSYFNVLF